jgi:hypothetical protein
MLVSPPEPAFLLSSALTKLAPLERVVMTSSNAQPSRLVAGVAEVKVGGLASRSACWIQFGARGRLRITITAVERHPPGRTIIHFSVRGEAHAVGQQPLLGDIPHPRPTA